MNDFFQFNRALLESMTETLTGGEEARKTFQKRQKLRAETYQAMLKYWGAIVRELDHTDTHHHDRKDFEEATDTFYNDMVAVFKQFDDGVSYNRMGLMESFFNRAGELFHKNVFGGSDSYRKEIEYEFEQFWNNFFKLKGSQIEEKELAPLEVVKESIVNLGTVTIKEGISKGVREARDLRNQGGEQDKQEPRKGFSVSSALDNALDYGDLLLIDIEEAELKADLITRNLSRDWIRFVSEELADALGEGQLMKINPVYDNSLNGSFVIGNAFSTYLCAGNYKTLYFLLKEDGNYPELIEEFSSTFEGENGIKILNDNEDNDFLNILLEASLHPEQDADTSSILPSKSGMMYAMTGKVRKIAEDLIKADKDKTLAQGLMDNYLQKAIPMHNAIEAFRKRLNKTDLRKTLIGIMKTQHRPEFYRYWVNKAFWRNEEDDFERAANAFISRTNDSFESMEVMMDGVKNAIEHADSGNNPRNEITRDISDRAVSSIAYMIMEEYEEQFNWFLRQTIFQELELRNPNDLSEVLEWIAQGVARQSTISLRYRLALVSSEATVTGDTRDDNWRQKSFRLFSCLAMPPKVGAEEEADVPELEKVDDLHSARAYATNFLATQNYDTTKLDKFCHEFQHGMETYLKKQLKTQLEYYYPGSMSSQGFDPNVNYDHTTFKGVMGELLRNVSAIVERQELTN